MRFCAIEYAVPSRLVTNAEITASSSLMLDALPDAQRLRLPMRQGNRSLNLSNAAAGVVFEAWRQLDFAGGA